MKTLTLIFGSRKVWIALAAVATCVVVLFGADPAKWTPLITAIVTLASVVIASIGIEDAGEKFGGGVPGFTEPELPNPTTSGKSSSALSVILLGSMTLLFAAGGCANTPESLTADALRRKAVEAPISEYVSHHPEQSQTWTDFLRAWDRSLAARGATTKPATPGPSSSAIDAIQSPARLRKIHLVRPDLIPYPMPPLGVEC